jgi:hypothetical protein
VPVNRDRRGLLSISAYPAIVGPPATNSKPEPADEDSVEDADLVAVAQRAMRNYLAANRNNLLADLTPDARISLPADPMTVDGEPAVTWVVAKRRIAVELNTKDRQGTTWTLRYELDVRRRDRWYVRSVQVDPAFRGQR